VNKKAIGTGVATALLLLSLVLVYAPAYVASFWSPIVLPPIPGYSYPNYMNQAPTCTACSTSDPDSDCSDYVSARTITAPNNTFCNPSGAADSTCIIASQSCKSYCEYLTPVNGVCVMVDSNSCPGGLNAGNYAQQCAYGPSYDLASRDTYANNNPPTTAAAQYAAAGVVMNYWVNTADNTLTWEVIAQWAIPAFLLTLVSHIDRKFYKGGWQFLAVVVGTFFAFINTFLSFLYVWITTSMIRVIVFPPSYATAAYNAGPNYGGARAAVAGIWFMWFSQIVFLIVGCLWIRANATADAEEKPLL